MMALFRFIFSRQQYTFFDVIVIATVTSMIKSDDPNWAAIIIAFVVYIFLSAFRKETS